MMQGRTQLELYNAFLGYVSTDIQKERKSTNRRMLSIFIWCVVIPVLVYVALMVLVVTKTVGPSARQYVGIAVLAVPICYALFVLGSDILRYVPELYRRGGVAKDLGQLGKDAEWRQNHCQSLEKALDAQPSQWAWICSNFRMDLRKMSYRNGYMTIFAGGILYFFMQGIDLIGGEDFAPVQWIQTPMGWVEQSSNNPLQFVGLAFVCVFVYLSGTQNHQILLRYLDIAELILAGKRGDKGESSLP